MITYTNIFALDTNSPRWMEAEVEIKNAADVADRTTTITKMFNSIKDTISAYADCGSETKKSKAAIKQYLGRVKRIEQV